MPGASPIPDLEPSPAAHPAPPRRDAGLPAEPIELVAIDVDGTLLTSRKQLSKRCVDAVAQVQARGVRVVLASARPPRSTREIHGHLGLDTPSIHYNGALIYDLARDRAMHHSPLPPWMSWNLVRFARRIDPDVTVSVEILDRWYTDFVDREFLTETARKFAPDFVGPFASFLHQPATKIMFLAPPARMVRLRRAVAEAFQGQVSIAVSDDYLTQVIHKGVDKGQALAQLSDHLGVRRERVMAIGDAPNDVGMISWAGWGVAVGNAWEKTRLAADAIVPSNDDDGVAHALETYVLRRGTVTTFEDQREPRP